VEYRDQMVRIGADPAIDVAAGTVSDALAGSRLFTQQRETLPAATRSYLIVRDPGRRSKDQPPFVLPPDNIYVLADNRNHGRDSRDYGPVPRSRIRGTVLRRVNSLLRWEKLE
jgi:hypothetical protein